MKEFEDYLKTVTLHSERERAVADSAFRYALESANTWYSMDTAPKDGTKFRIKIYGKEFHASFNQRLFDNSDNKEFWFITKYGGVNFDCESAIIGGWSWQPIPEFNKKNINDPMLVGFDRAAEGSDNAVVFGTAKCTNCNNDIPVGTILYGTKAIVYCQNCNQRNVIEI